MGVGISRSSEKNADDEFPIRGPLGLSESQKIQIKSTWDKIGDLDKRRSFMATFLFKIMTENQSLKVYFRLKGIADEELSNHQLFQTHIGNFSGIFRVVLEGLVKKTGAVQRKARTLGAHHRSFEEVKFKVENWLFLTSSFIETLHKFVPDLNDDEKRLWNRFLNWFFSQMHRAYELGENYDSDENV